MAALALPADDPSILRRIGVIAATLVLVALSSGCGGSRSVHGHSCGPTDQKFIQTASTDMIGLGVLNADYQSGAVEAKDGALSAGGSGSKDELTSITFERRFSPSAKPDTGDVKAGDTLLGGQVMALAIDAHGAVRGCHVVAAAGDLTPDYGCDEAKAERFEASAARSSATPAREGYLTVLVYGHSEHVA